MTGSEFLQQLRSGRRLYGTAITSSFPLWPSAVQKAGVDFVIIGPHDLSVSLGLPEQYTNPRFEEALQQIISKVSEKGLGIGIHFPGHCDLQIKWSRRGLNVVLHSSDLFLFQQSLQSDINTIRRALGDEDRQTTTSTQLPPGMNDVL